MDAGLCSDGCGSTISHRSKTGRCRACACRHVARDPQRRARTSARLKEKWRDPAYRTAVESGLSTSIRERIAADAAFADRLRQHGAWLHSLGLHRPHLVAGSPARRKMGETRTEGFLGWCPSELRQAYRALRLKHFTAEEARAIVLDHASARQPEQSPFERQLDLVRQGRALVERFTPTRPDHPFTLGGVSAALL